MTWFGIATACFAGQFSGWFLSGLIAAFWNTYRRNAAMALAMKQLEAQAMQQQFAGGQGGPPPQELFKGPPAPPTSSPRITINKGA